MQSTWRWRDVLDSTEVVPDSRQSLWRHADLYFCSVAAGPALPEDVSVGLCGTSEVAGFFGLSGSPSEVAGRFGRSGRPLCDGLG